jgi:ubiquinone/menaquinone biosynthesis C-methylase UbiE
MDVHDPNAGSIRTFDERAEGWDTPRRIARAQEAAQTIAAAIDIPSGCRAIEVGAGTGLLGLALRPHFERLVLADTSDGMLAEAGRKIRDGGFDDVTAEHFDLASDPSPPGGPFDLVLSLLLLHHVQDTQAALAGMYRLLAPGGQVAAIDLDTEDGSFHSADAEGVHHHGFDRERLADLARGAGFADVRIGDGQPIDDEGRAYPMFLLTGRRA